MRKLFGVAIFGVLLGVVGCDERGNGASTEERPKPAQVSADLAELLSSGAVSLVRASGNGSSSGNSIDAVLRNNTQRAVEVDVYMRQPVYLRNSGVGQNMIASMVVGADGGYVLKGGRSVVTLRPSADFPASMVAYCADFEKENPTAAETFSVDQAPGHLAPVIARINEYVKANPNAQVTTAAQIAVWMAQDERLDRIAEKFDFTSADEQLARTFLQ